jgi:hypothetical protein
LTTLGAVALAGCASSLRPADYAAQQPVLDLKRYLDGRLVAHGVFTDRAGRVKRRFIVQLQAHWQGEVGTLEEDFVYSDGAKERRVWTITHLGDGRYRGTAADVVGEAQGEAAGNSLRWAYTLRLPVDGDVYEVDFEDWFYLMDEQVLLNKATMSKFGLKLGEVTLAFRKLP